MDDLTSLTSFRDFALKCWIALLRDLLDVSSITLEQKGGDCLEIYRKGRGIRVVFKKGVCRDEYSARVLAEYCTRKKWSYIILTFSLISLIGITVGQWIDLSGIPGAGYLILLFYTSAMGGEFVSRYLMSLQKRKILTQYLNHDKKLSEVDGTYLKTKLLVAEILKSLYSVRPQSKGKVRKPLNELIGEELVKELSFHLASQLES